MSLQRLRVSENRHFLVREDGSPFFWLGDTGWYMWRITPGDVDLYMSHRAKHDFTIIQVYCGFGEADYAGRHAYRGDDTDAPNEDYWRNIDSIVSKARDHGLYIALVAIWGSVASRAFGDDAQKAYRLGKWLGTRYRAHSHLLWVTSGEYSLINEPDYLTLTPAQRGLFNALAGGLREGHGGTQLMTIHPGCPPPTSSLHFHHETWLDFNMLQTGHCDDEEAWGHPEVHTVITNDYNLTPTKPVLDGEPFYEDTPDGVWDTPDRTRLTRGGADVARRKAYWSVFAGAFGHTYGHNDVCIFHSPSFPGEVWYGSGQRHHWKDVLDAPGATQMKHLRSLMESLPFLNRIPDQSVLACAPGTGRSHLQATRAADGSYALVYMPTGGAVRVRMDRIASGSIKCAWFDPRTGTRADIGVFPNRGTRSFTAPGVPGPGNDWVLVLAKP